MTFLPSNRQNKLVNASTIGDINNDLPVWKKLKKELDPKAFF